jgi:uncharacterized membrane protein YfcA
VFFIITALIGFSGAFVSSTFGGGAGLVFVPGIYWLLTHTGHAPSMAMQITLATSSIVSSPLGIVATWRQYHYKNFDASFLKRFLAPTVLGSLVSVVFIHHVHTEFLKYFFAIVIFLIAVYIFFQKPHKQKPWHYRVWLHQPLAFAIGLISILIGTSAFTVPFFLRLGLDIRKAVGTASIVVFAYSMVGGVFLTLVSLHAPHLPKGNVGYLNLPIFLVSIIPVILGSYLAVKFVNNVNPQLLQKLFVVMMLIAAIAMIA